MRLLVLSDLHLEVWRENVPRIDLASGRPDVVVLAGDIHTAARAPAWAAAAFPNLPVIYVSGNHEFYGSTLDDMEQEIWAACRPHPAIRYLSCEESVIGDVRFLGCTLWTDYFLFGVGRRWSCMLAAREQMNDYHRIRVKWDRYRKLHPSDTVRLHAQHKDWLKSRLREPFNGTTVVVTHMAPSKRSVSPQYEDDPCSAAFASDLEDLVELADVWIHGHTHESFDYQVGKCRVVCNPLGYLRGGGTPENHCFDPGFIVEV
jgi:predicted phosphodiesterase